MLRGDAVAPELRWRDEEGVHRSQARPRPSPREQLGAERFAGLVGSGQRWRTEPGWRGDTAYRTGGYREAERPGLRPGYRPGASGGWRQTRGGSGREASSRGSDPGAGPAGRPRILESCPVSGSHVGPAVPAPERFPWRQWFAAWRSPAAAPPFIAGEIADRGPLERGLAPAIPEPRARDAREAERQRAWRDQAARAIDALKADEGTAPINAETLDRDHGSTRMTTTIACLADAPGGDDAASSGSRAPASCRRSGSCRTASAASASSRRFATCSCR